MYFFSGAKLLFDFLRLLFSSLLTININHNNARLRRDERRGDGRLIREERRGMELLERRVAGAPPPYDDLSDWEDW